MSDFGRVLIFVGLLLVGAGAVVLGLSRLNVPLGRLPGDVNWRGRNWSVSFPIVTCLLLSVLISLIFWVVNHLRR
jgi:hypothetical protein